MRMIFEDSIFVVALDGDGEGATLRKCFTEVFDRACAGLQLDLEPMRERRVQDSGCKR